LTFALLNTHINPYISQSDHILSLLFFSDLRHIVEHMLTKCSIIKRSTRQNVYIHNVNKYTVTTHTATTHSSHCRLPTMVWGCLSHTFKFY